MANATATPAAVNVGVQVPDWTWDTIVTGDVTYSLPADVEVDAVQVVADVPDSHAHVPWDTWRPRFSPDSLTMLVCRTSPGDHDTDLTSMQLWLFVATDFDDNEPLRVKGAPSEYGWVTYGHPEWAPDSTAVVIFAETVTQWQILALNSTDYTTARTIYVVTKPDFATDPSYGPDGTVYFVEASGSSYYLASVTDGATPVHTRILTSSNVLADPMISEDGTTLAYAERISAPDMSHSLGVWALNTVPVAGGDPTVVLSDGNAHQHPTWMSPRYLLFQTFRYGTDSDSQIARIRTDGSDYSVLGAGEYPSPHKV